MPEVDPTLLPKPISFTKASHRAPYPFISPTRPELSARGRNVVITGGGTGIGKAIGIGFAKAGAQSIAILGRRLEPLKAGIASISEAASDETQVLFEQVDLLDKEQTTKALVSIAEKVGKIDIFVSNAGSVTEPCLLAEMSIGTLFQSINDHVVTAFNAIQAFLPLAGSRPVLLSTNTCMAHIAPIPTFGPYSIARAAALKMTDFVAAENPHVHVVSIQPGWVPTAMNGYQKEAPDTAELPGSFYVWLASIEAEFMKGKFVWANWDAEELLQRAEEIKSTTLLNWTIDGVPM